MNLESLTESAAPTLTARKSASDTRARWALVGLFVVVLAQYSAFVPEGLDTVLVVAAFAVFAGWFVRTRTALRLPVWWTMLFAALAVLFCIQSLAGRFAHPTLALYPFYTAGAAFVCFFGIPRLFDRRDLFRATAIVSVGLLALGALVWVAGVAPALAMFDAGGGNLSIYVTSNIVGMAGVVGCVGMVAVFDRTGSPRDGVLAGLSGLFAFSTFSRGVWLSLVVGLALYLLDTRLSRRLAVRCVTAGALALAAFVVAMLALPADWIRWVPLTNRQWLWRATWAAIAQTPSAFMSGVGFVVPVEYIQPFVGVDLKQPRGPHNAYLLVWLRAGVFAFAGYLVLVWGTIAAGYRRGGSPALCALCVAFAVDSALAQFTLWSVRLRGVLFALLLGLLLCEASRRTWTLDIPATALPTSRSHHR
jgi:O-antigen ligase